MVENLNVVALDFITVFASHINSASLFLNYSLGKDLSFRHFSKLNIHKLKVDLEDTNLSESTLWLAVDLKSCEGEYDYEVYINFKFNDGSIGTNVKYITEDFLSKVFVDIQEILKLDIDNNFKKFIVDNINLINLK